ncbi:MAG: DUF6691 family protein [Methylophilus sp.]|nr:DUF6691 family protein [Methylophilus sp.]
MKSPMLAILTALLSGLLFGLGLLFSGLANPAKVLAFLDLAGLWDISLALVMAGGISISMIAFTIARKRSASYLGLPVQIPSNRQIDRPLIMGAALFGIGWGLAGICPGPAVVLLGAGSLQGVIFLVAMLIGMGLFEVVYARR